MSFVKSIFETYAGDFFKKGHQRSINAKKNILLMLVIRGGSILISFFLVPLTINYVNPTRYGVWITLSSIISWFSFFDIGFGNGLRNKFAEAVAKGENDHHSFGQPLGHLEPLAFQPIRDNRLA
jgi:hypothetical protein